MNWSRVLHITGLVAGFAGIALTTFASAGAAPAWVGGAVLLLTQAQKIIAAEEAKKP